MNPANHYVPSISLDTNPEKPSFAASCSEENERIMKLFSENSFQEVPPCDTSKSPPIGSDHTSHLEDRPYLGSKRLDNTLPPLTGIYAKDSRFMIGHTQFVIEVPRDDLSPRDRLIGVEIYAPTERTMSPKLPIFTSEYAEVKKDINIDLMLSPEQKATLYTHAHSSLCLETKMPVVVFSHRLDGNPTDYRPLLEELASHGYILISLNHPSSSGNAPFTQENLRTRGLPLGGRGNEAFMTEVERLTAIQANNIEFIVDLIHRGELHELSNLGPINQIVLAGHSIGGAASVIASRKHPNIVGCINLDGGLLGDRKTEGLEIPMLTLLSKPIKKSASNFAMQQKIVQDIETFHENSPNSHKEQINNCTHYDFGSLPALLLHLIDQKPPAGSLQGALQTHKAASLALIRFLNSIYPKHTT
jgi:pimeloyl-ACP methyl ester carboxylesterase